MSSAQLSYYNHRPRPGTSRCFQRDTLAAILCNIVTESSNFGRSLALPQPEQDGGWVAPLPLSVEFGRVPIAEEQDHGYWISRQSGGPALPQSIGVTLGEQQWTFRSPYIAFLPQFASHGTELTPIRHHLPPLEITAPS